MTASRRLLLCLVLAALAWAAAPEPAALRTGLALLVLTGSLWLTQALHLTLTALLVPLLAVLAGLLNVHDAVSAFAHPVVFLFLGGFVLAAALQRQGLDRELAGWVLRRAHGRRQRAAWLLFALTALLSMWISNTATAALMLPLALGLLAPDGQAASAAEAGENSATETGQARRDRAFVLLGVAYAASIGGIGTLVGSPPNAIAASHVGLSFSEWLLFGLPLVLVLLPLMGLALLLVLRPRLSGRVELAASEFHWTRERRLTVLIFACTAAGWIFGAPLAKWLGLSGDTDTLVALAAVIALVGSGCLSWKEAEAGTQWGILLLFGGGIALSEVMEGSGASTFLAGRLLELMSGAHVLLLLPVVIAFVVFLSELASNTAVAALLIPVFADMAGTLGLPPAAVAAAIAAASSCGFMLPVATPPNALVYGTGLVPQKLMLRAGFVLNLIGILAISVAAFWWR